MPSKNCLILSLLPKHPVKSGMQNTVFYLNRFLSQKNNTKFLNISSTNIIDPILNLKHSKIVEKKIQKAIETQINQKTDTKTVLGTVSFKGKSDF